MAQGYGRPVLAEPDGLSCDQVRQVVADGWRLPVARCEYLPEGLGAHHWLGWRDGPAGARTKPRPSWFISADQGERGRRAEAPYAAARALADAGLDFVLAPMRAMSGRVVVPFEDWMFSVTRYVPGRSGPGPFANDRERADVAALLGQLHSTPPPTGTPRPQPQTSWPDAEAALADLDRPWTGGPMGEAARALVRANAASVRVRIDDFARRTAELLPGDVPWVLSHGEPHTANVRWTDDGRVLLVDWDTLSVRPPESDLGAVLGTADGPEPARAYVAAGGVDRPLRPELLDLFDRAWDLAEIDSYLGQLHAPHPGNADDEHALADVRRYLEKR